MTESSKTDAKNGNPPADQARETAGPEVPEDPVATARKEAAASQERYLRAVADLENFRKRVVRERDELRQNATASVIEELIPIMDNLALGLAAARQQTDVKPVVEGVGLVLDQFKTTLARLGLKEINPAGADFDPHLHECIAHQASAAVGSEKVIQVVRLGYTLNGRLLRPASVIVSSGPARPGEAQA